LPAARHGLPYSSRTSGDGEAVPNATLKVPTGGGKTLLATVGVTRILNKYLRSNTGLVLWIVPNEAIFTQTQRQLADRDHPYRQTLDRASAGRVKLLTKDSPLSRADVDGNLCVLLLMLQSANRQTKETLRLFRDRGNVHGFVPSEAECEAHADLIRRVRNLDTYADEILSAPLVKDSLGNVMRILRPVVVMDEGHRAFAPIAYQTLLDFNPSFLLELTATPRDGKDRWANLLVDVAGTDLDREEMIKMPINLEVRAGEDWKDCLRVAWERTQSLRKAADDLRANSARYIRPIMVVQVERTGKEQLATDLVHAEHVRTELLALGVAEDAVALKTAEVNELNEPEKQDLRSPRNPVRVVITKQALQEGWDCPFAYTLCSLTAAGSLSAMTQMVGRIMRQPDAQKTGIAALDECYVYCFHPRTGDVVKAIKSALEQDGMGDLAQRVVVHGQGSAQPQARQTVVRGRRPEFRGMEVCLPQVQFADGGALRRLEWETDILSALDWSLVQLDDFARLLPRPGTAPRTQVRRIGLEVLRETAAVAYGAAAPVLLAFDRAYAARAVADIVANPFVAFALVDQLARSLQSRGWTDDDLGSAGALIVEELRKWLASERDRLAEDVFRSMVSAGTIQFRLRADASLWRLPDSERVELPSPARRMLRPSDGEYVQRSLFEPVYEDELNGLEFEVACYLDEQSALSWWYRNVVRENGYYLQGWRKSRIYPDFILATRMEDGIKRLIVLETKGDQLAGSLDTQYKRRLMDLVTDSFLQEGLPTIGTLELEFPPDTVVECRLVQQAHWRPEVDALLRPSTAP